MASANNKDKWKIINDLNIHSKNKILSLNFHRNPNEVNDYFTSICKNQKQTDIDTVNFYKTITMKNILNF